MARGSRKGTPHFRKQWSVVFSRSLINGWKAICLDSNLLLWGDPCALTGVRCAMSLSMDGMRNAGSVVFDEVARQLVGIGIGELLVEGQD